MTAMPDGQGADRTRTVCPPRRDCHIGVFAQRGRMGDKTRALEVRSGKNCQPSCTRPIAQVVIDRSWRSLPSARRPGIISGSSSQLQERPSCVADDMSNVTSGPKSALSLENRTIHRKKPYLIIEIIR